MNSKKKHTKIVIISIISTVLIVSLYLYLTWTTPSFLSRTYELGEQSVSKSISDYINAKGFMYNFASLNLSNVKEDKVGDYEATLDLLYYHFTYNIQIVDTTKPSIKFYNDVTIATYNEYSVEDIAKVTDYSDIDSFEIVSFKDEEGNKIDIKDDCFVLENPGQYTVELFAEDEYGNSTKKKEDIYVVEAPHFMLLGDRCYKVDSDYDLMDFVYAEDKDGNDLTDSIVITDDGGYEAGVIGSYDVSYVVTDKDDIERSVTINISIDNYNETDYGFEDEDYLDVLIDHEYFEYEPLEDNTDYDRLVELTSPTSFSIKYSNTYSCATGSCYIYKITPEKIYFITNNHCADILTSSRYFMIYDYEGNVVYIEKDDADLYKSRNVDIMVFSIPVEDIELERLLEYKEALIDWGIYSDTSSGTPVVCNTQEWGLPDEDIHDLCKKATIASLYGTSLEDYSFTYPSVTLNEPTLVGGMSGSPLYDYNGYLIGTAEAVYYYGPKTIDAFIRLDDLKNLIDSIEIE